MIDFNTSKVCQERLQMARALTSASESVSLSSQEFRFTAAEGLGAYRPGAA